VLTPPLPDVDCEEEDDEDAPPLECWVIEVD